MRDILLAALKVAIATSANLLGWMLAVKIISVQLGAAGVGLFGILRQLLQYFLVVGTFAGHTALIQGIASRMGESQRRYAESVQAIIILMAFGVALFLFLGAPYFAHRFIPHPEASLLLRWLALAALFTAGQTLYTSVLTGYRLLNQLVLSQVVGPICAIGMVLPMIWLVRSGASAGFVLMLGFPAAGVALTAAWFAWRAGCLPGFHWRIAKEDAAYFFHMSLILLSTGVLTTGAPYFVSRVVAARLGLEMAGYYWVAWTLSMAYVTLALGSFGSYYMPSLSRLSDPVQRRSLIRSYLLMAVVVMPVLVSLAILFKPMVIRFMFSVSLLPALKVMRWMLIGDFFKGISWVLSFPMLAFHEMKWFFWSEVLFTLGLAVFGWLILLMGGSVESLGILFLILYLCYTAIMAFYAFLVHGFSLQGNELLRILVGISLVGTVSALTWNQQAMNWGTVGIGLGLILIFLLLSIKGGLPIRELVTKHAPDLGGA